MASACSLVLLTTFLTPIAHSLLLGNRSTKTSRAFSSSLLLIETAMIGVFVSLDLFLFFVVLGAHADPNVFHDRHVGATTAASTRP